MKGTELELGALDLRVRVRCHPRRGVCPVADIPLYTTPTSSTHTVPSLCTLLSPRRWSAPSRGFSTLGSIITWTPGNRCSSLCSASRMLSWRSVARFQYKIINSLAPQERTPVHWYTRVVVYEYVLAPQVLEYHGSAILPYHGTYSSTKHTCTVHVFVLESEKAINQISNVPNGTTDGKPLSASQTRLPSHDVVRENPPQTAPRSSALESMWSSCRPAHDLDPDRPHYLARRCFPRHLALRQHLVDEFSWPPEDPAALLHASTTNPCTARIRTCLGTYPCHSSTTVQA
jgi:hypothetical protein